MKSNISLHYKLIVESPSSFCQPLFRRQQLSYVIFHIFIIVFEIAFRHSGDSFYLEEWKTESEEQFYRHLVPSTNKRHSNYLNHLSQTIVKLEI